MNYGMFTLFVNRLLDNALKMNKNVFIYHITYAEFFSYYVYIYICISFLPRVNTCRSIGGFQPILCIPRDFDDKGHDLCAGRQNESPIDNLFSSTSAANVT